MTQSASPRNRLQRIERAAGASVLVLLAAAMASGFLWPGGAGSSSGHPRVAAGVPAPIALLGKITVYPSCLDRYHMQAEDAWTGTHDHSGDDWELDQVSFHDGVGVEIQTTYNGRPLKHSALQKQESQARELVAAIDAVQGPPGHLLNLAGEIWTVERFESQFTWTATPGPVIAGRPSIRLQFRPDARVHPHSRMQEILHHSAGDITVDADSGQVLAGRFSDESPVNFGAGLLAHITTFSGSFTMQPLVRGLQPASLQPAGAPATAPCWAMNTIVVHARGRKLFHSFDGTETMTYRVTP